VRREDHVAPTARTIPVIRFARTRRSNAHTEGVLKITLTIG
jgi:hypothetical protein